MSYFKQVNYSILHYMLWSRLFSVINRLPDPCKHWMYRHAGYKLFNRILCFSCFAKLSSSQSLREQSVCPRWRCQPRHCCFPSLRLSGCSVSCIPELGVSWSSCRMTWWFNWTFRVFLIERSIPFIVTTVVGLNCLEGSKIIFRSCYLKVLANLGFYK